MEILCHGLSHRTAPVEVRERFALSETQAAAAAKELTGTGAIEEAVVVSTCNRVEFYLATCDSEAALQYLADYLGQAAAGVAEACFYSHSSREAVQHLFRLVCGLDSMVLGETEVFGQVKKAYGAASEGGGTARHLNRLFQRAFNVGKEVRTQTKITRGAVSVGSVAVDLAEKIFGKLASCQVMILGAGETSEQTARSLLSRGARSLFVSNRSFDRAAALAASMGGRAVHFDRWHQELEAVDILISSTSAPHWFVTKERLEPAMRRRVGRPLFVIDLAVPRDIDPAVNQLEGVYLYDIDSLQAIAADTLKVREQEVERCEAIIERHVAVYLEWLAKADGRGAQAAKRATPSAIRCQVVES